MRRDTNLAYWSSRIVRNPLISDFKDNVTDVDSVYRFLNETITENFIITDDLYSSDFPSVRSLTEIVDPIRFRQVRTIKTKCAKVWNNLGLDS